MSAKRAALAAAAVALVLSAALVVERIRDRERVRVPSPDQNHVAVVRSHWTLDPPSESLWLGGPGERPERLATLAEDMDWCSEVVWARDSQTVAFVITGTRALVVEVGSRDRRREILLVDEDDYPSSREARSVRFTQDGESLVFRDCLRGAGDCRDRQVSTRSPA